MFDPAPLSACARFGSLKPPRALMTGPNGDLDPWADWIVAQRFKYVQVSAFYDQTADVTASELMLVPQTPFGNWIAAKQPQISMLQVAADLVQRCPLADRRTAQVPARDHK